ncbi:hypothetical protein KC726_02455 [Candidatus Woesebacteria bacterium]|nr:hypothetical protein [Candidatus Woesebacteria bacterium]
MSEADKTRVEIEPQPIDIQALKENFAARVFPFLNILPDKKYVSPNMSSYQIVITQQDLFTLYMRTLNFENNRVFQDYVRRFKQFTNFNPENSLPEGKNRSQLYDVIAFWMLQAADTNLDSQARQRALKRAGIIPYLMAFGNYRDPYGIVDEMNIDENGIDTDPLPYAVHRIVLMYGRPSYVARDHYYDDPYAPLAQRIIFGLFNDVFHVHEYDDEGDIISDPEFEEFAAKENCQTKDHKFVPTGRHIEAGNIIDLARYSGFDIDPDQAQDFIVWVVENFALFSPGSIALDREMELMLSQEKS